MLDVRDYCESHKLRPSPEMDLDKIKKIVEDDFGGQIGIWGSVERVPGAEGEIYDLVLKCVDFSAKPKPKVIYETKARTKSVSEIPHLYVKQMLDALAGKKPGGRADSVLTTEDGWRKNKNLVAGDFEHGAGGVPKGWDKVAGQQREPLGGLVRWTTEKGNAANKVVRFTLDRNVAENEGVMYYSDFFPVEEGAKYRFQCRWRSDRPRREGLHQVLRRRRDRPAARSLSQPAESQGPQRQVEHADRGFHAEAHEILAEVGPRDAVCVSQSRRGRVRRRGGQADFARPPGNAAKVRRHSSESKITVKEMEENERRSGGAK